MSILLTHVIRLMMAAFAGHLDIVKTLRNNKAGYELRDIGGLTAIHWACDSKKAQLVDWMLNDGANVEARDNNGYTPLIRVGWSFTVPNNL